MRANRYLKEAVMRGGHNFIDMTGRRIGRLKVIAFSHSNAYQQACWTCECECGNTKVVKGAELRRAKGPTLSCGCLRIEAAIANITAWNASDARKFLHKLWREAKRSKQ